MEQALYVLLGGLLAILGGIYQSYLNQVKEDKGHIFNLFCVITDYTRSKNDSLLVNYVLQIKSKKYQKYVKEIIAFSLIDNYEEKKKYLQPLLDKTRQLLNKKIESIPGNEIELLSHLIKEADKPKDTGRSN